MMSGEVIRDLSRQAALKARRERQEPFVVEQEDIEDFKAGRASLRNLKFPNLGDYRPKGFKLVDRIFVDSSGFGSSGEPALTQKQFFERLKPGFGYAVVEAGQFQVYVGEFEVLKAKAKAS